MKRDSIRRAPAGQPVGASLARGRPLRLPAALADRVGVTHADGSYHFTDEDFMSEGARAILALGSRVIKIWFTPGIMDRMYPYNSRWPRTEDLVTVGKSPYIQSLFAMPFTTFILEVVACAGHDWSRGLTADQAAEVREEYRVFAAWLLSKYAGSGKTFVLQNWESDNALGQDAPASAVQGMIDWANARQAGIEDARQAETAEGVIVAGAIEVNKISTSWSGARVIDAVVPHTRCDLYSYSNWETGADADLLVKNLDRLASRAPASGLYGRENIFLGEFGAGEMIWKSADIQLQHARVILETALSWGVRYAVYWELYCNDRRVNGERVMHRDFDHPLTSADLAGFWLVRPDGSESPVTPFLRKLLASR